jgi:hypothetical protein
MGNPAASLPAPQHQRVRSEPEAGLTLIAVIGLLAMISVGLAVFSTSMVRVWDRNNQGIETRNLHMIANGIITYLRQNKAFPNSLTTLSPEYVAFSPAQITRNARGFPRYYLVHPSMAGFQNSTGLTAGELVNARFLLLSDLTQDAAPTATTPIEFENWWSTDERATPNLLLHRENIGNLFYSLSITPKGNGASFSINQLPTDSNGALLPAHGGFHLIGTEIGFDEDNSYITPDILFALTTNTAYWFDPLCVTNRRWNPLDPPC